MNRQFKFYRVLAVAGAVVLITAGPGLAHGGPGRDEPRTNVTGYGKIVVPLPRGSITLVVGNTPYHVHDGRFYRKGERGYYVVEAPRGACLRRLPWRAKKILVDGHRYYTYNGVWYQRGSRGFTVVAAPVEGCDLHPREKVAVRHHKRGRYDGHR